MVKMLPAAPFSFTNVAILAPPKNPAIKAGNDDAERVDYTCYNCDDVLISAVKIELSADVLIQCARCTAYNQFVASEPRSAARRGGSEDFTLYRLSSQFRIPLDAAHSTLLGQLTAVWGQLDEMMLVCIALLLKCPLSAAAKMLETQTASPRVNMLLQLTKEHADPKIVDLGSKFHTRMSPLISKRNHIIHGIWGYFWDENKKLVPACRYSKVKKPFFASDLLKLASDTAGLTHNLAILLFALMDRPKPPKSGHPDTTLPFIFTMEPSDAAGTWSQLCAQPQPTPAPQPGTQTQEPS